MTKLLILDKDGTLVRPASGNKFVQNPQDQELIPGVAEALEKYKAEGWAMAISSNQGGVAAGHKSMDEAAEEMRYAMELTGINYAMFAPSYETHCSEAYKISRTKNGMFLEDHIVGHTLTLKFRKPNSGMIVWIRNLHSGLRRSDICYVGDRAEDQQAAQNAGVCFMWAHEWRAD